MIDHPGHAAFTRSIANISMGMPVARAHFFICAGESSCPPCRKFETSDCVQPIRSAAATCNRPSQLIHRWTANRSFRFFAFFVFFAFFFIYRILGYLS